VTETSYDRVEYPSVIHDVTLPDRLAVAARLAGLDPVPPERARVLEVGGGSCLTLMSFAAAHPQADCHGFDLAPTAVALGREMAGAAVPNLHLVVEDIMAAHQRYPARSFDYVLVHGVYAWVPPIVREALMAFIAHVLSDRGVAFVSYNAQPGGHVRMILREMIFHAVEGIEDHEERVSCAFSFLKAYVESDAEDDPLQMALRTHAASMMQRPPAVLFHDEMGDCYYPQSIKQVVAAAEGQGLRFLTDAGRNRGFDGFLPLGEGEVANPGAEVLRRAQTRDFLNMCFFRATLLVRGEAQLDRRIVPQRIDDLWISAQIKVLGDGEFSLADHRFAIADPVLAQALADLAAIWPERRPIRDIVTTDEQRHALLTMYIEWYVNFHTAPAPFAATAGERPEVSPWVRGMLSRGERMIFTLNHKPMNIDQDNLRDLLVAADGTRTVAELEAQGFGFKPGEVSGALTAAAKRALLRP
jgi:hypothetical protein